MKRYKVVLRLLEADQPRFVEFDCDNFTVAPNNTDSLFSFAASHCDCKENPELITRQQGFGCVSSYTITDLNPLSEEEKLQNAESTETPQ